MSDFLQQMAQSSRARVPVSVSADADTAVHPLILNGFDLIAEVKLSAPSAGVLCAPDDPMAAVVAQAKAYAAGGAAAISVLTEPSRFGGSLAHLRAVARAVDVPVMRKDFLVSPVQVHEARIAGASGVLLILAILDDSVLEACLEVARGYGMFVLLEAFDGPQLDRAARYVGPGVLLGLNCRDLRTLDVVPERLTALGSRFPAGAVRVAESGLYTPADAATVAGCGYALALVGSALMTSEDPAGAVAQMVTAGRMEGARCVSV